MLNSTSKGKVNAGSAKNYYAAKSKCQYPHI